MDEVAQRQAGQTVHQFADQMAVAQYVISGGRAGAPPGCLGSHPRGRRTHVVQVVELRGVLQAGDPRGVGQQVPHLHVLLPLRGELGPVARDRRVKVEFAGVDEQQGGQTGHGLRDRPDVGDRVALPGLRASRVVVAAPQIHHAPAVDDDDQRHAHLGAAAQLVLHGVEDAFECRADGSVQFGHADSVKP